MIHTITIFLITLFFFSSTIKTATITNTDTQDNPTGTWKPLDMNSFTNLIDFCYSKSLRKSYEDFYDKYNDFPGKLISVDRQIV